MYHLLSFSLALAVFLYSDTSFAVDYKTFDLSDNKRGGIGVLIKSRISEAEANEIGARLTGLQNEDYTVMFHLENQPLKGDHWAGYSKKMKRLKHFDYKALKIHGTTKEEYNQLLDPYEQPKERRVLGQWVDARFKSKFVYTLYQQNESTYLESVVVTTKPRVSKVKLSRFNGGIKITDDDYDDPNSDGEFLFFINGEMQYWSKRGHFLTLDQTRFKINKTI